MAEYLSWPDGTQTIGYDAKGRVETLTTGGSTLTYTYDGPLVLSETWSGTIQGSLVVSYNNDFKVNTTQVNSGNVVSYEYDGEGLLKKAGEVVLTRSTLNGLLMGTSLGGVTTERDYNGFGELKEERGKWNQALRWKIHYDRDGLGRITQKVETVDGMVKTFDYGYNLAGRLAEVKRNGSIVGSYAYDANGNRLNDNAVYDAQDRLLSAGSSTYTYTTNGELLTKNNVTYQYDVFGNLRQVELPGKVIEYVIDGRNRRIGRKVNGILVQGFLYQGSLRPVAELDGSGSVVARFVYGSKGNVPDYMLKGGKTYRIISDHLGSPRWVVDVGDGSVVQEMEFDAWGKVVSDTNPGFQPFGFAGGIYDLETKLVRFGVRDYDAEVGRWTSKDPILFGGGDSNLFGYVLGDPVNFIDPEGKFNFILVGSIGLIGGAIAIIAESYYMVWTDHAYAATPFPGIPWTIYGATYDALTPLGKEVIMYHEKLHHKGYFEVTAHKRTIDRIKQILSNACYSETTELELKRLLAESQLLLQYYEGKSWLSFWW